MPDGRYGEEVECDEGGKPEVERPCQAADCSSPVTQLPFEPEPSEEPYISNKILMEERTWRVGAWTQVTDEHLPALLLSSYGFMGDFYWSACQKPGSFVQDFHFF